MCHERHPPEVLFSALSLSSPIPCVTSVTDDEKARCSRQRVGVAREENVCSEGCQATAEKRRTSADASVSSEPATGFKNRIPIVNKCGVRSDIACLTLRG
jgi:hypothetical protein